MSTPTGYDWYVHTDALLKACLGFIGPNFRLVQLELTEIFWKVSFILEFENELDKEDVQDIFDEYGMLVEQNLHDWKYHDDKGAVTFSDLAYLPIKLSLKFSQGTMESEFKGRYRNIYCRKEEATSSTIL